MIKLKLTIKYTFLTLLLFMQAAGILKADTSKMSVLLAKKINQARLSPWIQLSVQGIDSDGLESCYNKSLVSLDLGMAALTVNDQLTASAEAHAAEQVTAGTFSKVSQSGSVPRQRMWQAGYRAGLAGEMIAAVFFSNYLSQAKAVNALYGNLLRIEAGCENESGRSILFDPELSDMGIAVETGILEFGSSSYNYYIAVLDFAAPMVGEKELNFFSRLNTLRKNPETLTEVFDDANLNYPTGALGEMKLNTILSRYAAQRAELVVSPVIAWIDGRSNYIPLDDKDLKEALGETGYHADVARECIFFMVSSDSDQDKAYEFLFKKMLKNDLAVLPASRGLLNASYRDVGLSLISIPLGSEEGLGEIYIYIMAAELGASL